MPLTTIINCFFVGNIKLVLSYRLLLLSSLFNKTAAIRGFNYCVRKLSFPLYITAEEKIDEVKKN